MELSEVLKRRYSCRKFAERPVDRETLIALAKAGRLAPSGCNSQRWVFVIVDEEEPRRKIADALYDGEMRVNTFSHQIPAFLVLVNHPARDPNEKQKKLLCHAEHSSLLDLGAAAENICLAATDLGLGSIIMGWFRRDAVKEAIGLPEHLEAELIIGVGYPLRAEPARRTNRLECGEVIRINSFDVRSDVE